MTANSASTAPISDGRRAPSLSDNIPALDGVRGIAILLVLFHNVTPFDSAKGIVPRVLALAFNPGWMGVLLFFVLSGFLISGILLDSRESPRYFRAFYARRFLRIFPLYYAVLLFLFVGLPLLGLMPEEMRRTAGHQIWLWLYLTNVAEPLGLGVFALSHLWSLAVEEQFYIAWPLVVRHAPPRRLLWLSLGLAVLSLCWRALRLLSGGDPEHVYVSTLCRMDALVLGAALAAAFRVPSLLLWLQRRAPSLGLIALAFVALAALTRDFPRATFGMQTLGYTALALLFAALIARAVVDHLRGEGVAGRLLSAGWLRTFGKYSYALYVFHQPVNLLVGRPWLARHGYPDVSLPLGMAYLAVVIGGSLLLAIASYHALEKHFLGFKRYFVAGPAEGAPSAAT